MVRQSGRTNRRHGEIMARHIIIRLKDGRNYTIRTEIMSASEQPINYMEEIITEQYDRIHELEQVALT